jgi:hypothetical protein
MAHRVFGRQDTFVGVQNRKGNMKALRGDFSSGFIDPDLQILRGHGGGQTRHGAFDNVFSYTSMQVGAGPLDFHIDNAIQDAIDFLNDYGELWERERRRKHEYQYESINRSAWCVIETSTDGSKLTTLDRSRGASS